MRLRDRILQEWVTACETDTQDKVLDEIAEVEEAIIAEQLPGERELVRRINRLRRSLMHIGRGRGPGALELSELETHPHHQFGFIDDLTMIHVMVAKRVDRWYNTVSELKHESTAHACRVSDAMTAEAKNVKAVPRGIEPVIPLGYTPPIDPLCVACRICKADVGTKCDQTWARNPRTTTD